MSFGKEGPHPECCTHCPTARARVRQSCCQIATRTGEKPSFSVEPGQSKCLRFSWGRVWQQQIHCCFIDFATILQPSKDTHHLRKERKYTGRQVIRRQGLCYNLCHCGDIFFFLPAPLLSPSW